MMGLFLFVSIVGLALLILQPFSLRLALFAMLTIVHLDAGGPGFSSLHAIGWINAFKALVLPSLLLLRLLFSKVHRKALLGTAKTPLLWLWLLFIWYTATTATWGVFPLASIKFLGALSSHTLLFLIFYTCFVSEDLDLKLIIFGFFSAAIIALLQTFLFGNPFGGSASLFFDRLSSFSSPQSFAQYLVAIMAFTLWKASPYTFPVLAVGMVLLVLTGSRLGLLGGFLAIAIWALHRVTMRRLIILSTLCLILLASLPLGLWREIRQSRAGEIIEAISRSDTSLVAGVGTFRWRSGMYSALLGSLRESSPAQLIFGHGTSSAGTVALRYDPQFFARSFSPSRVAHNEFLRVLYEEGIIGVILIAGLGLRLLVIPLQNLRSGGFSRRPQAQVGPLLSLLPLLLLVFAFENILQAAASPGVTGFILVLSAYGAATNRSRGTFHDAIPHTPAPLSAS